MPKINGNEIRPGYILEHDGGLWVAVKVAHVKPGKGGAFAQVELKNIRDGRKLNERFRSADKVERVRLDQKDQQFLYESDGLLHFMDTDTYDQFMLTADQLGEATQYLKDGMTVDRTAYQGETIGIELPVTVDLQVLQTEPGFAGDTQTGARKPATTETGLVVQVPLFVNEGDTLRIDTRTGEYVTRVQ